MKLHFVNILHSAFSDCDRNWLDRVLALMYSEALGLCSCLSSHKMVSAVRDYHAVKMLNLSNENKVHNYVKTKCCILLGCIICIQERKWHEQMSVTFVCMASNTPPPPPPFTDIQENMTLDVCIFDFETFHLHKEIDGGLVYPVTT